MATRKGRARNRSNDWELSDRCSKIEEMVNNFEMKLSTAITSSNSPTQGKSTSQNLSPLTEELQRLKSEVTKLRSDIDSMSQKLVVHEDWMDDLEQYSRRNCLLLHGIPEKPNEDATKLVLDTFAQKLNIELDETRLERSHRIGAKDRRRTAANVVKEGRRPIIVKFISYRDRDMVWKSKRNLKNTGLLITESLTSGRMLHSGTVAVTLQTGKSLL